jgi:eukaryotic-like serine/threonine-protein kinase
MGEVYAAYDPEIDRRIAIKLLKPDAHLGTEHVRERLQREARAMGKLAHPHVVGLYDVGEAAGRTFLAMEFVEGVTLHTWLRQKRRGPDEVLAIFLEAGRGLSAAHAAGLVHRDFKPANVLIGADDHAKVTDFGLARATDHGIPARPTSPTDPSDGLATSTLAGTPAYMAPEQKLGLPADARSDQYSFCVSLHEALYGTHPADATSPSASAKVSGRIRRALARGLQAIPEARYPSMSGLLADLDRRRSTPWMRVTVAAAAVLSAGSLAYGYKQHRASAAMLCGGGDEKIAKVWNQDKKDRIAHAFAATGKPFAANAWRGVLGAVDSFTRDWSVMHREACEATRVRGEQSAELLDLRMECLDDRLRELRTLTDLYVDADAVVVTNAVSAAESLTRIAYCADTKAMSLRARPPTDPAAMAEVDRLRMEIAELKAMQKVGKYKEALPRAQAAVQAARATGLRGLEAEALYRYGSLQGRAGDFRGAEASLYETAWAADAAGDDSMRAQAWGALLYYSAHKQAKFELAPVFHEQAMAALARLGGDDAVESFVLGNLATELSAEKKYDEALRAGQRALSLQEKTYGPDGSQIIDSLNNIGSFYLADGRYAEALPSLERALTLGLRESGADHPRLIAIYANLGEVHLHQLEIEEAATYFKRGLAVAEGAFGTDLPEPAVLVDLGFVSLEEEKYEEALGLFRRADALLEKQLKPDNPRLVLPLLGLGQTFLGLKDAGQSLPYLERAITLPAAKARDVAYAKFALARALFARERDPKRAFDLAVESRDALSSLRRGARDARELARVEAWIDDTRAGRP